MVFLKDICVNDKTTLGLASITNHLTTNSSVQLGMGVVQRCAVVPVYGKRPQRRGVGGAVYEH